MVSTPITSGGFQPYSGFGYDMPRQDGIFGRHQFLENMMLSARRNEFVIREAFGKDIGGAKSRAGTRSLVPTSSNLAVGDVTDTVVTSSPTFPDYVVTDAPTINNTNFLSPKIGAGTSMIGIPLPLQAPNEGVVEVNVDQHRGTALLFTKRFLETAIGYVANPNKHYSELMRYALMNDFEEYLWLCVLYSGPITATAGDYGTGLNSFTDSLGITNRANYALTRTLTSINGASNLITPTATGTPTAGMSNTSNARFSNSVPWLFGNTASDLNYDVFSRLKKQLRKRGCPKDVPINVVLDPKGYEDTSNIMQFSNRDMYPTAGSAQSEGELPGKIKGMTVYETNVIQPAGASSNVLYGLAGAKDSIYYDQVRKPELVMDDMRNKAQQCMIIMGTTFYGAAVNRPDHMAVLQYRIDP